jgi:hypothetical protein
MNNKIKRYILLAGHNHYPERWEDFIGTFDTVYEAQRYALSIGEEVFYLGLENSWAQIIDTFTMKVVSEAFGLKEEEVEWGVGI